MDFFDYSSSIFQNIAEWLELLQPVFLYWEEKGISEFYTDWIVLSKFCKRH
jgi:hypothetical protein